MTIRVAATGMLPSTDAERLDRAPDADAASARLGTALMHLPGDGESTVPLYDRALLQLGHRVAGPAVIQQMDATTVFLAGQSAFVSDNGDLIITEDER